MKKHSKKTVILYMYF